MKKSLYGLKLEPKLIENFPSKTSSNNLKSEKSHLCFVVVDFVFFCLFLFFVSKALVKLKQVKLNDQIEERLGVVMTQFLS